MSYQCGMLQNVLHKVLFAFNNDWNTALNKNSKPRAAIIKQTIGCPLPKRCSLSLSVRTTAVERNVITKQRFEWFLHRNNFLCYGVCIWIIKIYIRELWNWVTLVSWFSDMYRFSLFQIHDSQWFIWLKLDSTLYWFIYYQNSLRFNSWFTL